MLETSQPPRTLEPSPYRRYFLVRPKGSWYTTVLTRRFLVWNEASPRSARRLNASCAGEFSLPFTPPALRNCGALVMAFENVYDISQESPFANGLSTRT